MTTPAESLLRRAPRAMKAAGDVGSPCVSICRMDPHDLCEGCLRSLPEIAGWSRMDDAGRRAVWGRILERAKQRVLA